MDTEDQTLQAIFDLAAVGMAQIGLDGVWLRVNNRYCQMLGYSESELRTKTLEDITHPDDCAEVSAARRQLLEGTITSHSMGTRFIRRDGTAFWGRLNRSLVRDDDQSPKFFIAVVEDITEKVQVEHALRDKDQQLVLAQSAARLGLWDRDLRTGIAVTSGHYAGLHGLAPDSARFTLEEWLAMIHPDDRERIQTDLQECIERTHTWDEEFRVVWPDGSVHWLLGKGQVFLDDSGRPVRLAGASLDITDRKRVDEALRESEERFRRVFEEGPIGLALVGRDFRFLKVNRALCQMVAYSEEALLQMSFPEITHPDDLNADVGLAERLFRREIPFFKLQKRYVRKDGEILWANLTASVIHDHDGQPRYGLAMIEDITDVKRVEQELVLSQALRESEAKYHRIVETMTEGVWVLDHDGRTSFVNHQMAAMLGYRVEEILGRHVLDFKDEEARPIALEKLERRRQGITEQYDSTFQTKDGRRLTVLISTCPLWDGEGRYSGSLGIITDITERSRLEERLHQVHKMEAIGRLAGGVAHDFNNLLTVINGQSDLLLGNLNASDRIFAQLAEIRSAGQRAQELTSQMLAFSRSGIRATEVLSLQTVVEDVGKMLRRMIGEDIELVTDFEPGLGQVKADRTEITQILLNLAVNARDAMPGGGILTFTTRNVELDERQARNHPGAHSGAYVVLTVVDTGIGMDAETQRHLFEPFFTTKQAGKGTGLGLATVYGIVSQRGGWIQVKSKPRGGTTFQVYLPRVDDAAPETSEHPEPGTQELRGTETVLVVEDQPDVRKLTCTILREFGYQILEASHGEAALRLAATHEGPLDLVLTDVIMPGMQGPELAKRLQTIRRTPILFMSGYSGSMEGRHDSELAYIHKPFTPNTLARKVREVLGTMDRFAQSPH